MERAEKIGLGVAAAGHIILFGVLSVNLLSPPEEIQRAPAVEVTIADDIGLENAAPTQAMLPPATSQAPELGPPDEADSSVPDLQPLTEAPSVTPTPPSAQPRPSPAPSPRAAAKLKPKPKPAAKAKPSSKPKPPAKAKPAAKAKPRGSRLGNDFLKGVTDSSSTSQTQTVTAQKASPAAIRALNAEVTRQLKPHWQRLAPTGADAELLRTKISFNLNRDGSLSGSPRAISTTGETPSNSTQLALHSERAIAAVRRAAPFKLPEKFYDEWKSITYDFDKSLSR